LLPDQHVNDASAAKHGLHDDPAGAVAGHASDDSRLAAEGMGLHCPERGVGIGFPDDAGDLSLIREIERIKA
jgi:hypothetical protein